MKENDVTQTNANKNMGTTADRNLREKPGFFSRFWHSWTGKNFDDIFPDKDSREIAYYSDKTAFELGLSKEEAYQVGIETATIAKARGIRLDDLNQDKLENLMRGSSLFTASKEGKAYIDKKFGNHNEKEMEARRLADKYLSSLTEKQADIPNDTQRANFHFHSTWLTGSNYYRIFSDPKDLMKKLDASNLAFSLGIPEKDANKVGEEVYELANNMKSSDKNYNLDDLLNRSVTFRSYEQGTLYLKSKSMDIAIDSLHREGLEGKKMDEQDVVYQKAKSNAEKYNIPMPESMQAETQAGESVSMTDTPVQEKTVTNGQQYSNMQGFGIGDMINKLMSSWFGRILMIGVGYFLTKALGGSGLSSILVGGVGGLLSPVIGGFFGQNNTRSTMAQQGIDQLEGLKLREKQEQAEQNRIRSQAESNQREVTTERVINSEQERSSQTQQLSDKELLMVVKEKGINGVHEYFGNDDRQMNDFLTRNNLVEIARNESRIRLEGGDWLKATRDALQTVSEANVQQTPELRKTVVPGR